MTIQYAMVAKEQSQPLSEYTDYSGNFRQVVPQLLEKLRPGARQTFEAAKYSSLDHNPGI